MMPRTQLIPLEHHFLVSRTARYFTLGELNAETEQVWIVLHGYGQLAGPFIKNFAPLADDKTLIIAPEALSRFYLSGFDGKIGATWMTREHRLHEINDYIRYLDALYQTITDRADRNRIHVTVLAFSQGVPAACRWLNHGHAHADRLVLWAGVFPPDVTNDMQPEFFRHTDLVVVYGTQDEYVTPKHREEYDTIFQKNNLRFQTICFDGGHRIDEKVLTALKGLKVV